MQRSQLLVYKVPSLMSCREGYRVPHNIDPDLVIKCPSGNLMTGKKLHLRKAILTCNIYYNVWHLFSYFLTNCCTHTKHFYISSTLKYYLQELKHKRFLSMLTTQTTIMKKNLQTNNIPYFSSMLRCGWFCLPVRHTCL